MQLGTSIPEKEITNHSCQFVFHYSRCKHAQRPHGIE